jgi:hypothetical protein
LFANRGDPGTNRTDYTTRAQPIRDGDGSNLALASLGLPPIPGSFIVPAFATPVFLHIARLNDTITVFWSDPNDVYDLQAAADARSTEWQTITEGITINETTHTYTIGSPGDVSMRYFRLLKR